MCVIIGKTHERQALIDAILSSDVDLANRETRGIIKTNKSECFEKKWLEELGKRVPYVWEYNPSVIYVGIDPSGNLFR